MKQKPPYLRLEQVGPHEWAFNDPREWEFFNAKMLRVGDAIRANDFDRAEEMFVEIVELCSDYLPAFNDLGCLVDTGGDTDWAIALWEEAIELGRECIPEDFAWEHDRIPWHFESNRPFLMALENLGRARVRAALDCFRDFGKLTSGHHGMDDIVATLEPITLLE